MHEDKASHDGTINEVFQPRPVLQMAFLDLKAQFAGIRADVMAAIARVMESQHFILGPEVEGFEKDIAHLVGCKYAVGCASGSDALLLALMALGVGPGDEVITSPFTFIATAGSIRRLGARPVFVDIDAQTYNLDPSQLEDAITSRTKAVIPVHLFGLSADMDGISQIAAARGIPIIEDAAQAILAQYKGRRVGSMGVCGCFSFFPSKNLGAAGDGGIITANQTELYETLKLLRVHGSREKYQYDSVGMNSRLDALQAAILRAKLAYLHSWTGARQRNANRYRELFAKYSITEVSLPTVPLNQVHVYNQFTIRASKRDALKEQLRKLGIPTEIYYPRPLHLQPAFRYLGYEVGDFPESEAAAGQVLSLPIFPELTDTQQETVVGAVADFYRAGNCHRTPV